MFVFKNLRTKIIVYFIIFVFLPIFLICLFGYHSYKGLLADIIIGMIVFLFAILYSRRITRPLNALIKGAHAIGQGNLEEKITINTGDEFQILAQELELLRMKLSESYLSLEGKINRRTRELKEAQAQIIHQEKMASLGLMAAGIAHEIGNPLTSISSIAQVIKRRNTDIQIGKYINDMQRNIDRISRIVRELVDFSRPSNYKAAATNINDIIKSSVGIIKYDRRSKDLNFVLRLDPDLPETVVVSDQLLQVFLNVLINAVDACEGHGNQIEVQSFLRVKDIIVVIKDNGCGIPEVHLLHIFEPFYTTKEVGRGTGLGLTVSYGIIQQLGGEIKVASKVNQGSTFEISIPLLPKQEDKQ